MGFVCFIVEKIGGDEVTAEVNAWYAEQAK